MSHIAIRTEALSKCYRIGDHVGGAGDSLREAISHSVKSGLTAARLVLRGGTPGIGSREHWAIRDISFEIEEGSVVGIVGRNGAGKSTLLKVLSRITEPTSGWAQIRGRVGSLLEVGTGFHPELTGRENIFLSGAILGMRTREIVRQFDAIVEFADLERFVDTPVKHYSSGMQVRLGFAVAAHLDTEILLVDEVLAVGDAGFQKKCLSKVADITHGGRTVLFVSHNMGTVETLCERCILLEDGAVAIDGPPTEVIKRYMERVSSAAASTRSCPHRSTR